MPQTALAVELGLSAKAVEMRMARARRRLRSELRRAIEDPEELL